MATNNKTPSLCWFCYNSYPTFHSERGCSWSRYFKPVEGWEAEAVANSNPGNVGISYRVIKCPEYVADEEFTKLDTPICEQRRQKK